MQGLSPKINEIFFSGFFFVCFSFLALVQEKSMFGTFAFFFTLIKKSKACCPQGQSQYQLYLSNMPSIFIYTNEISVLSDPLCDKLINK